MTRKSILEELAQAGWDPFSPSPECRAATRRPAMSDRLTAFDAMGIHWNLVLLQLFSRFARGKARSIERGQQLQAVAVLFVLTQVSLQGELTPKRADETAAALDTWFQNVLIPSTQRMREATEEEVWENPKAYEPALSASWFESKLGLIDSERDRRAMSLGLSMHEQKQLTPNEPIGISHDDFEAYFGFISQHRFVSFIDATGKFRLSPMSIKSAMDGLLKPPVSHPGTDPEMELERADEGGFLAALQATEAVAAARRAIETRRRKARPGATRHALDHFEQLTSRELTFRDLAKKVGMSKSALQEAFAKEVEAIRGMLEDAA